jgi:hypothetical protein
MRGKIIVSALLLGLQTNIANAGLDWTTVHSRANCLNNESITWWYLHPYNWRVISLHHHIAYDAQHQIDTGFNYTWRAHAIHWGEPNFSGKWEVWGYHYLKEYSQNMPFDFTYADDCKIIDGW